jgi:hypothetical protein
MTSTDTPRPRARLAAAALVGLEGLAAVVAGAGFVVAALVGDPSDRGDAVVLGILLAVLGAGIGLVARGLLQAARWAAAPALLTQFFALVVAWNQRDSSIAAVAAVTGVVALAALAALVLTLRAEG